MAGVSAVNAPVVTSASGIRSDVRRQSARAAVAGPSSTAAHGFAGSVRPLMVRRAVPVASRSAAFAVKASNIPPPDPMFGGPSPEDKEPDSVGTFFGTYLQIGVWVTTLSFAGFTGYSKMIEDPDSAGILVAPPTAALFLIGTFSLYNLVRGAINDSKNKTDDSS